MKQRKGIQLRTLIKSLHKVSFDEIPQKVRTLATLVILDTIGVIILGNKSPYISKLTKQYGLRNSHQFSTIIGHDVQTFPHLAGLVNGSGGTIHELDEGHRFSKGHPGIHVVPAALAIGEHLGVSGKSLLRAVVLGYEFTAKVAIAMQPLKSKFHPHGTWGTLGAAYTSGLLLGFSDEKLEQSVHMAAAPCMSPGRSAIDQGATVRNLYAGVGIMNGILAAMMVKANVSAPKDGLQTYAYIIGTKGLNNQLLLKDVASYYEITRNYFKLHAACAHVHSSIDAMKKIMGENDITPHDTHRVYVKTYLEASKLTKNQSLNPLSAKFSIPYSLASLLLFKETGYAIFEESKIRQVESSGLLEKIIVSLDPICGETTQGLRPSTVMVTLKDGTKLSGNCPLPKGNFDNPYSRDDIVNKFHSITGSLLEPTQEQELINSIQELENLNNIRDVMKLCRYRTH